MTEQELNFVENQLKKIGLAEAFTPELIDQLKKGERLIRHTIEKNYDGDEAKAVLHLKKSDSSNLYFFNKYELGVRKDGQTDQVNHTFYINNFKRNGNDEDQNLGRYYTTFTFKAAFNYLSGRPVLNTYQNQKGEQYQSWDVLNTKKVLPNGKMEEKHYHENYGYNLEKVLRNYSIKELANPEYTERLIQSLQRGNLQSVTFVGKEGKTEKLFISPDIPLGSLRVYDESKTRITTQDLVEKEYIGKELAQKIQERINSISHDGKESQKQNKVEGNTQKQSQVCREENTQKQETEKPEQSMKGNNHRNEQTDGGMGERKKQTKKQRQKLH